MRSKMQKRWTALVAVMLLLLVVAPLSGVDFRRVSAASDFTVNDAGLLTEYTGSGGHVTIPSGVKRIHTGAFHSNTKITGVTFPSTLTEIDPYAFRGCTGLTSVAFPSSLITIGDHAFYECSNLTSVKLSVQLTTIGNGAFAYCPKLTKFDTASCTRFNDEKGVLYRNWASVVAAPAASVVSINSGATSIQEEAFEGNTNLRTVSLSTNMRTVGAYAFRDCSYMYSVNLPDSVTSVGKGAFSGCEALPSISVSKNLTKLPQEMFKNCTALTSVKLNAGTTGIGISAFDGCTALKTVTLPDGLTTIGNRAFRGTSSLTSVTLPSSLQYIYDNAFEKSGLTAVTLPASVVLDKCESAFQNCTSLKSVTFMGKAGDGIAKGMCKGCTALTSIQIPQGMTYIGGSAFEGCTSLSSVGMTGSLKTISASAFQGCTALTKISIPSSVTDIYKSAFAGTALTSATLSDNVQLTAETTGIFANCPNLKNVTLPQSATVIPQSMFYNCPSLTSIKIPSTVTSIGKYAFAKTGLASVALPNATLGESAFEGCTALGNLVIPAVNTSVSAYLVAGCTSLKTVTIPSNVISIGRNAFDDCSSLKTVFLPSGIKLIAADTFRNCTSLTSITIPANVTTIGAEAFLNCTGLKTVTVKATGRVFVYQDAFKNCASLTTLTVPGSLSVRKSAFYGCESLAGTIQLADTQTEIEDYTFYNCKKLQKVYFSAVNKIGQYAFAGCENIDDIYLYNNERVISYGEGAFMGSGLTWITLSDQEKISDKAFMNCTKLAKVTTSGLNKTIGKSAFEGCTALKSICLTEEVQDRAFYGCTAMKDVYTSGLVSLGASAFEGCTALETFPFPKTLTSMGTSVFEGCTALTKAILPSSLTAIPDRAFYGCTKLTSPNLTVKIKTIGNYAFYKCTAMENLILPAGVTTVGSSAFEYCSGLKMVNMTNNITQLGSFCFDSCTALTTVYFSTALTAIPASGFRDCSALTNVNLSKTAIKSVGSNAFYNCSAVTSVSLPDTVTSIGDGAFYNITKPASVTIPKAVTSVGRYAFSCPMTVVSGNTKFAVKEGVLYSKDFTSLLIYPRSKTNTTVTVASGVTAIGSCAFYGVTNLKIVNLPDTVKTIDASAFSGCANLTTVKFSQNVKEIKAYAFSGCKALDTVNYTGTQAQWNSLMASGFYTTGNEAVMNVRRLVVNFGKTVSAMTVKSLPTKKVYTVGETFNPAGMTLNVTYTDGFKDVITKAYTYTPTGAMNALGNQKIVVSYGGKSTGFYVTVNPKGKTVSSMAVKTLPTKRVYAVGETFDPTGMTLKITYSDSSTAIVSSGFSYTPVGKFTATGQQKMVVNYAGKTTGFYVTVTPAVSSVAIKTKPAKQTYTVGEYFESTGMILKVTYADGTTADVSSGYTYTPTGKFTAAGQQKITVTYGGKSTTLTVTVTKSVSTVAIKTKPTKQIYTVGEYFESAGMTLKITYTDSTTAEVTSGYTYTPTGKLTTAGQQKIVVSYGGKSTGFYVTVNEAGKTVSSVVIKTKPTKQTYTVGESFNPAGMVLKITYTDNTTAEISGGYTYTPTGKLTTEGQQKIVVSYGGKSTGFYVTVNPAGKTISGVAIKTLPTKRTYNVGEIFNPTGMTLKITYSDMSTAIVSTGYSYTPTGKLTTAGQQKIVVTYGGKSTGFYVTVNS